MMDRPFDRPLPLRWKGGMPVQSQKSKQPLRGWQTAALVLLVLFLLLLAILALIRHGDSHGSTIRSNRYDASAFYRQDGFLHYSAAEHSIGIDVSVYQDQIDWQRVREAGVEFAILRIGLRSANEGLLYEDTRFRENYDGAKAVGIRLGVYFFSQAQSEADARQEADFVCQLLQDRTLELPVFFDWEPVEGGLLSQNPSLLPLTQCAVAFCRAMEAQGYSAGVYFNQTYGYRYYDLGMLQDFTLWLAEYNETPGFDHHFDILQYSDNGHVDGISGKVDLDLWILPEKEDNS